MITHLFLRIIVAFMLVTPVTAPSETDTDDNVDIDEPEMSWHKAHCASRNYHPRL